MILTLAKDLIKTKTNHKSDVIKKVMLSNDTIPNLMMFNSAIIKPNDNVESHQHETMYEVFYINKGNIEFTIDSEKIKLTKGDTVTIEPKEIHSLINTSQEDCELIYFGISTDLEI